MSTILRGSDNLDSSNVASDTELGVGLALKANTADLKEIGVGQTRQDVTASRSLGVTYTNTTGKPIELVVTFQSAASGATWGYVTLQSGTIYTPNYSVPNAGVATGTISVIIPNLGTYIVGGFNNSIIVWLELR